MSYSPSVPLFKARNTFLEKMPLFVYGASWGGADSKNTVGGRWTQRFADRHQMTLTTRAVSGAHIGGVNRQLQGTATPWVAGAKGLILIGPDSFLNSVGWWDFTVTQQRDAMRESLRSILSAASSVSRIESSTFTETGGGFIAAATKTLWSNSNARATNVSGAYWEFSATVNSSGRLAIATIGTDAALFGVTIGDLVVAIDGVTVATYNGGNRHKQIVASTPDADPYVQNVILLSGITPGSHTIRLTHGGNGTWVYADCAYVRSTTPPPIIVMGPATMNWAAVAGTYGRTATETDRATCISDIQQVISDGGFTNATYYDTQSYGFDYATMLGDDNLHPNDKGSAFLADTLSDIAQHKVTSWNLGIHTQVA